MGFVFKCRDEYTEVVRARAGGGKGLTGQPTMENGGVVVGWARVLINLSVCRIQTYNFISRCFGLSYE